MRFMQPQEQLTFQGQPTPTASLAREKKPRRLEATANVRDVFPHQVFEFQVDAARVEVTFGEFRRKVDLRMMQNKPGVTYDELMNVLGRAFALMTQKHGRVVEPAEFNVVGLHLSIDFLHLKLEGLKAVTLQDMEPWLLRLYNKGDTLRSEVVLKGGAAPLDKAIALMGQSFQNPGF